MDKFLTDLGGSRNTFVEMFFLCFFLELSDINTTKQQTESTTLPIVGAWAVDMLEGLLKPRHLSSFTMIQCYLLAGSLLTLAQTCRLAQEAQTLLNDNASQ